MKILVLNPHIDAEHNLVNALQVNGVAVLLTSDIEQAWQVLQLHGASVDLALVHREGGASRAQDYGLSFVFKVKGDPTQSDLPLVVTSENWGDAEFANHQATPMGANAYMRWPCTETDLFAIISAVVGHPLGTPVQVPTFAPTPDTDLSGGALVDAASVYGQSDGTRNSIVLEAPEITFGDGLGQLPEAGFQLGQPSELKLGGAKPPPPNATMIFGSAPAAPAVPESSGISIPGVSVTPPPEPEPEPELVHEESLASEGSQEILSEDDQRALAQELPYLFNATKSERPAHESPMAPFVFSHPVGDAVVPGGAALAPDVETLKKYLLLREQDVAALSGQLKSSQEQITALEQKLREEQAKGSELLLTANEQKRRIDGFDREKSVIVEGLQSEINDLRFQVKARTDKAKLLEAHVREATEEMERLKERVRADIRKIRVREKELENRLEILRKDSEVLIGARENKIIELKRKLDLLEFNMDLLQNQYAKERETSDELRRRLGKAAQVVRVAGGLLGTSAGEVLEELSNELAEKPRTGKSEREAS